MTASILGNLALNPAFAVTNGIIPSGSASSYMDSSVFSSPAMGGFSPFGGCVPFTGGGMAMGQNYYDAMIYNSDRMTDLQFVNNGNQHSLASYGEILQKNMPELAEALRTGEYGKAGKIYDEVYEAISKNYGREIMTHQDRLNMDQSIKATITRAYQQINGTTIGLDSRANDEGYFENGFLQGLTLDNHHRNSSEEIEAYMTGQRIEGYSGKSLTKSIGKALGRATNIGGFAAAGAAIGAVCGGGVLSWATAGVGAAIGAGVGVIANIGSWLFSNNQPTQITEA